MKVRGGERIGELATLVDPGTGVPPHIVALTGITTAMVTGAPRLAAVLPSLLEFLSGAVLVAHNAPFDAGFLRAACKRHGQPWPRPPVLCTARLARAVLTRDEAPSVRLGALAPLFGTATTAQPPGARRRPGHRRGAAPAARTGRQRSGVQSLPELLALVQRRHAAPADARASGASATWPRRCRPRRASTCSAAPRDEVLYVGTSGDLRRRVRSYFTAGERRRPHPRHGGAGRAGRRDRVRARRWRRRCASCG